MEPGDTSSIDKVMCNIFNSCDDEGRGLVRVTKLIEFITPYMQGNNSDLMEIKRGLDPTNNDQEVSSETFYHVMIKWADKYLQDGSSLDESFKNASPRRFSIDDVRLPFVQSTPRKSFGKKLGTGKIDLGLNISGSGLDKTYLEDQIKELNYQNKKYVDELDLMKAQLATTEEQNEKLHRENDKLNKALLNEREVVEELQKLGTDCVDIRDTAQLAQKQADKFEKLYATSEKENAQLKHNISIAENDKQNLQEKLDRMHQKLSEKGAELIALQTELGIKEKELCYYEEAKNDLLNKVEQHKKMMEEQQIDFECIKIEKDKLENILKRTLKKCSKSPSTRYSSPSEYQQIKSEEVPFTSPIQTHTFEFYNYDAPYIKKKSNSLVAVSPLTRANNTPIEIYTKNTSTYTHHTPKRILDITIPSDMSDIKVLTPTNTCTSLVPYRKSPLHCFLSPKGSETPTQACAVNHDFKLNTSDMSSDDELWKVSYLNNTTNSSFCDDLQTEMSKIGFDENHNCNYKAQFKQSEHRILELQYELQQVQNNELLLNNYTLEIANLKLLNNENEKQICHLDIENMNLKAKINDLREQQSQDILELIEMPCTNQDIKELENKYQSLTIEKLELELTNKENTKHIELLMKEFEDLKADKSLELLSITKDRDALKQAWEKLYNEKVQIEADYMDIIKLKDEICAKVSSTSLLTQKCKKETDGLKVIENQMDILTDDLKNLQIKNEELIREKDNLQSTIKLNLDMYNSQKIKYELEKKELQSELKRMKNNWNENERLYSRNLDKLRDSLEQCNIEKDEYKNNLCKVQENVENSINQMQLLIHEIKQIRMEMDHVLSCKKIIESKLQLANAQLASNEAKQFILLTECTEKQTKYDLLFKDYDDLKQENNSHKSEVDKKLTEIGEHLKTIEFQNNKIKRIKQRIEESQSDIVKLEAALVKTCEENEQYRAENLMLRESLSQVEEHNILVNNNAIENSTIDKSNELEKILINSGALCRKISEVEDHANNNRALAEEVLSLRMTLDNKKMHIKTLEEKLRNIEEERTKRHNFDRMIMQIDKLKEKIDYLSEQLNSERRSKEELINLRMEQQHEMNSIKRHLHNVNQEIKLAISGIHDNRQNLRQRTISFIEKIMQNNIDNKKQFTNLLDYVDREHGNYRFKSNTGIEDEINSLKMDIQIVLNTFECMKKLQFSSKTSDFPPRRHNTVVLRPATLLLRPISPDSPNLEMQSHQPFQDNNTSTSAMPDSAGITSIGAGDSPIKYEICDGPIREIQKLHVLDNLGYLFEDIKVPKSSEDELENQFHTLMLEFTIDATSIKKRCEEQFTKVNQTEMVLVEKIQELAVILKRNLKREALKAVESQIGDILHIVLSISRLGEQFGALRQEHKQLQMITLMTNYASMIAKRLESAMKINNELRKDAASAKSSNNILSRSRMTSRQVCLLGVFILIAVFVILTHFPLVEICTGGQAVRWPTWEDVLALIMRKEYRHTPPT